MQRRPSLVPDLYHIKRTTTNTTSSPPSLHTEICGTYTSLSSAQTAGLRRLQDEGYSRSSFTEYSENDPDSTRSWPYGEDILVHARRDNEIYEVKVELTPNSLGVRSRPGEGRVEESLFYVVQTNENKDGTVKETEIRGIHLSRQAAVHAAMHELLSHDVKRDWYKEYEEVGGGLHDEEDGGEQVVVRATGPEGEKYIVSVMHES